MRGLLAGVALAAAALAGQGALAVQVCAGPVEQPSSDYTENGATVTHNRTGLTWLRCSLGQTWNGAGCSGTATTHTWSQGLAAAANYSGEGGGWRLPSIRELASIVELGCGQPAVNASMFPDLPLIVSGSFTQYQSSTTLSPSPAFHWGIELPNGFIVSLGKTSAYPVLLVKGGATDGDFEFLGDTTAPDTTLTATPPATSLSSSATFQFTGTDNAGGVGVASFECKIDAGSFAPCTSPHQLFGLAHGSHTFQVRAKDGLGNTDASPASFTWTIDLVSPSVASITRNGAAAAVPSGGTRDFLVSFGVAVTGVDASDFSVTTTGTNCGTASVASVGSGTTTYLVSVNIPAACNGTVRLDLVDDDTIEDSSARKLGGTGVGNGSYTGGESYTVTATAVAPAFTSGLPSSSATVGSPYSHGFVAAGNPAPTFSLTAGTLPPGITLNGTSGVLSGTPTTAGSSAGLTVTASNGTPPNATQSFGITVAAAGTTTTLMAPAAGTAGTPITLLAQVTIASGMGTPAGSVTFADGGTTFCGAPVALNAFGFASCVFTPSSAATLNVTATYGGNANYNGSASAGQGIVVSGTPAAGLSLAFGTVALGQSSAAQSITISSSGAAALDISSVSISGDFGQTHNCPATLAVGNSCAVTVTFTPSAIGARTGTLTVVTNAPGGNTVVGLSGTGVLARTLTVTKSGTGTVASIPAGIDCGATCSATFADGAVVSMIAQPGPGQAFDGWSGACTGTGACSVTMNAAKTVGATFVAGGGPGATQRLTVARSGDGSGTISSVPLGISCGSVCSVDVLQGTLIQLIPTPAAGSAFTGWSGACGGAGNCAVVMNVDQSATATFEKPALLEKVSGDVGFTYNGGSPLDPWVVRVRGASGAPLAGIAVEFLLTSSGFGPPNGTRTVVTGVDGTASIMPVLTAPASSTESATVRVAGLAGTVTFTARNFTTLPNRIEATTPGASFAAIGTAYPPICVRAVHVSGASVAAPITWTIVPVAGGAGGTFAGGAATVTQVPSNDLDTSARCVVVTANGSTGAFTLRAEAARLGSIAPIVFSLTNIAEPVAVLEKVSGDLGFTYNGGSPPDPWVVRVRGTSGAPLGGISVEFVLAGSGFFPPNSTQTVLTGADGTASFMPTLSSLAPSSQSATVRVAGLASTVTFTIKNFTTFPSRIEATTPSAAFAGVGTSYQPICVRAVHASGAALATPITWTIVPAAGGAGGTFAGGTVTVTQVPSNDLDTSARCALVTANGMTGAFTLRAEAARIGSITPIVFNLTNMAVVPARVRLLAGQGQAALPGADFASPITVAIDDSAGNGIAGLPIVFQAPGGTVMFRVNGQLTGAVSAVTDSLGRVTSPPIAAGTIYRSATVVIEVPGLDPVVVPLTILDLRKVVVIGGDQQTIPPVLPSPIVGGYGSPEQFPVPVEFQALDESGRPMGEITGGFPARLEISVVDQAGRLLPRELEDPFHVVKFKLFDGDGSDSSFSEMPVPRVVRFASPGVLSNVRVFVQVSSRRGSFGTAPDPLKFFVRARLVTSDNPPAEATLEIADRSSGPQASCAVEGAASTRVTVGTAFPAAIKVRVQPRQKGVRIDLQRQPATSTGPGAALSTKVSAVTDVDGLATFSLRADAIPGSYVLVGRCPQLTSASFNYSVEQVSEPVPISLPGPGTAAIPTSSDVTTPISVVVRNARGTPLSGATVAFTAPNTQGQPGGVLTPATVTTGTNGVASTRLRSNGVPGRFVVTARVTIPAAAAAPVARLSATTPDPSEGANVDGIGDGPIVVEAAVNLGADTAATGAMRFVGVVAKAAGDTEYVAELVIEANDVGNPLASDPNGDADKDGIPNVVEDREGTFLLTRDNDVFANERLFVMQMYRDLLRREAEEAGTAFWTSEMLAGRQTRLALLTRFFESPEFAGRVAPLVRLYIAAFQRLGDYDGMSFWLGQVQQGVPLADIANAFAGSPEFIARFGALSDSQFIIQVYRSVLLREPDPAGIAHWLGQLQSRAVNRGQMLTAFSESAENVAAMRNEVLVSMLYFGLLRRTPELSGFDFWTGELDRGRSPEDVYRLFLEAAEFRARFIDY